MVDIGGKQLLSVQSRFSHIQANSHLAYESVKEHAVSSAAVSKFDFVIHRKITGFLFTVQIPENSGMALVR
jgi:hypothetical protein